MAAPTTTSQRRRGPLTWAPQTSLLCGLTAHKTAPSPSAYTQRTAKATTGAINCTPSRTRVPSRASPLYTHLPAACQNAGPRPPFSSVPSSPPSADAQDLRPSPGLPRTAVRLLNPKTTSLSSTSTSATRTSAQEAEGPWLSLPASGRAPCQALTPTACRCNAGLCGTCFLHGQRAAAWLCNLACGGVLTPVAFSLGPQHLFQLLNTTHCGSPIKSLCS